MRGLRRGRLLPGRAARGARAARWRPARAVASESWLHRRFGAWDRRAALHQPQPVPGRAAARRRRLPRPAHGRAALRRRSTGSRSGPARAAASCSPAGWRPRRRVDVLIDGRRPAPARRSSSTSSATARSAPALEARAAAAAPGRVRFHGRRARDEVLDALAGRGGRPPCRPAGTRTSRWRCWRRSRCGVPVVGHRPGRPARAGRAGRHRLARAGRRPGRLAGALLAEAVTDAACPSAWVATPGAGWPPTSPPPATCGARRRLLRPP